MVYETKDQILKRKKLAKYRLRSLVRHALVNAYWLAELEDTRLGENVKRNVTIILKRHKVQEKANLMSIIYKRILKTDPQKRTQNELKNLETLFGNLPCFKYYSPLIRSKLTSITHFQFFERGRVLVKEGHLPSGMYFILSGEVVISKWMYNQYEDKKVNQPINIIGPGDCFGEIALLYNGRRNATITTETDCELLCVYWEDFDKLLYATLATKHEQIKIALRRFDYFKNFSDEKRTECCVLSRIEQYKPQDIIYSQHDTSNFSYFILSGQVMLLQCLKIKITKKGKYELNVTQKSTDPIETIAKFPAKEMRISTMTESGPEIKHQFVDVASLNCGGVFGIGEEMDNRIIVARNYVQCLLIPRAWLFQKSQNIGNVWPRLKLFLNSSVPSQQKLFENYLNNIKWKEYKKKTVDEIKCRMNITAPQAQNYNIPIICRIEES
ncbi:unnamed protein product [Diamesa serratosioi]